MPSDWGDLSDEELHAFVSCINEENAREMLADLDRNINKLRALFNTASAVYVGGSIRIPIQIVKNNAE